MRLVVKNWAHFQHYKDRSPPWIKLHKEILDDRAFQRLPDASRALAPCLWLLASESKDGSFDGSVEEVAFRVRQTEKWVEAALKPLISTGFLIVVRDASELIAECSQLAVPETETETETKKKAAQAPFVLPDWVPKEDWEAWMEVRKAKKAVQTPYALECALNDLQKLRDAGQDPTAVLRKAISSSWKSLYAVTQPGTAPNPSLQIAKCHVCKKAINPGDFWVMKNNGRIHDACDRVPQVVI